jgi:hypothetical protein
VAALSLVVKLPVTEVRVRGHRQQIFKPRARPAQARDPCAAKLEATLLQPEAAALRPEYPEAIEYLSAEAYRVYHSLVYETDGFDRFFRESTVIGEIANL